MGNPSAGCTTTATGNHDFAKSTITCMVIYTLPDGTITVAANADIAADANTGAVTSGSPSGAYDGARGSVVSTGAKLGDKDTFTLTG